MTDKKFIGELASRLGKTKKETREFLDALEVLLKETVVDSKVKVVDLTFSVKDTKARNCINPQTKEIMHVPESKKLAIKPSKNFKSVVK